MQRKTSPDPSGTRSNEISGWDPNEDRAFSVRRDTPLARVTGALGASRDPSRPTGSQRHSDEAFTRVILVIRWGCLAISLALAVIDIAAGSTMLLAWCAALFAIAVMRTLRPTVPATAARWRIGVPIAEVAVTTLAVATTGRWSSPLLLVLLSAIIVLGLRSGLRWGVAGGLGASAMVIGFDLFHSETHPLAVSGQWVVQLFLVAVVTGYARALTGEANRQHSMALDRLGRLADANALLFSLHRIAQTLPASLDLSEVLDSTVARLRSLVTVDRYAILIFEEADASWEVIRQEGLQLETRLGPTSLAEPLRQAMTDNGVVQIPNLAGRGLDSASNSGLYTVLRARGAVIGLLAVESGEANRYSARDVKMVSGFVEPMALAIDNGRWFRRLRTVGADEERTRIARDLHDRIGQSLAFVAFELDRISNREAKGESIGEELASLRSEVRVVIGEVRETLYDLRTDVSDKNDFITTMQGFAARLAERSGLKIELQLDSDSRLPLLQEREMWRIAQESLTNVERHAKAENVLVTWRCDGESAMVRVADDGNGFQAANAGRLDSYGILGMRERAASVGAQLEFESAPGEGTSVTCRLGANEVSPLAPEGFLKDIPVEADRNTNSDLDHLRNSAS